jgi:hypothetical protein
MKLRNLLLIVAFLITAFFNPLNAQLFKGEVFGGVGLAQVDGDDCYGYKRIKGQIGAGVLLNVVDDWLDVGMEIVYNPKGAYKRDSISYSSYYAGSYDLKLNYMEIPVMVYFIDKYRYSLGIGVSYGRLIGFSEKVNGAETETHIGDGKLRWKEGYSGKDLGYIRSMEDIVNDHDFYDSDGKFLLENSNSYRKHDFSFCADARIRIWRGLHAQLRYQYSLMPIRTRMLYEDAAGTIPSKIRLQHNNQISLRVTYIFGEDLTKLNKAISQEEKGRR